ncbi:MAG: alpha/beta fold hydrolase, partial [Armatimonadota bacterium]
MAQTQADNESDRGSTAWKRILWTAAAVGAAAVANAVVFYRTPPLASPLRGGDSYFHPTPEGDLHYRKAGDGPPLLLLHGIGAGCSSFEWRHIFDDLATRHTVYALDFLGFGKSDKPRIAYSAEFYQELIADFCREVVGVGDGRGEADVIASSLAAAWTIAVAERDPSLFRRLVLVCPTGFEALATLPGASDGIAR